MMNSLKRVVETEPTSSSSPSSSSSSLPLPLSYKRAKIDTPATQSSRTVNFTPSSQSKRLLYSGARVVKVVVPSEDTELPDPALRLDEADLKMSRRVKPRSKLQPATGSFIPCSSLSGGSQTSKKEDIFDDSFMSYDFPFTQIENLEDAWGVRAKAETEDIIEKSPERKKRKKRVFNCKRRILHQAASSDDVDSIVAGASGVGLDNENVLEEKVMFTTASNKTVSESAQQRPLLMHEEMIESTKQTVLPQPTPSCSSACAMFATASNKPVQTSEKARERAQAMFDEVNQSLSGDFPAVKRASPKRSLFVTADRRPVELSDAAFRKGSEIFEEAIEHLNDSFADSAEVDNSVKTTIEETTAFQSVKTVETLGANLGAISMFSTASNKPVQLSDKAKRRALALFEEVNQSMNHENTMVEPNGDISAQPETSFKFQTNIVGMFSTASNKSIKLSENAQKRALAMFEEVTKSTFVEASRSGQESSTMTSMFSTASSKPVQVSEKAQQRALALFEEVNQPINEPSNCVKDHPEPLFKIPTDVGAMFSTASNKSIQLSDRAQRRALAMFEEVNQSMIPQALKSDLANSNVVSMFSTASCKPVQISEKAQQRALALFEEVGQTETTPQSSTARLISTATNKSAQLSAQKRTRAQFEDQPMAHTISGIDPGTSMFLTASKKTIQLSEQAQKRALAMFEEVNQSMIPQVHNAEQEAVMSMFSTAGNKSVKTSEIAKAKALKMFEEINSSLGVPLEPLGHCSSSLASHKPVTLSDTTEQKSLTTFEKTNKTDRPSANEAAFKTSPSMFHDRPLRNSVFTDDEVENAADTVKSCDPLLTAVKRKMVPNVESTAKKMKVIDDEVETREELHKRRLTLRRFQQDVIRSKKKGIVRACPGKLSRIKSESPRIKLENALQITPEVNQELSDEVIFMTSKSAEEFKFQGLAHFSPDECKADSVSLADYFHLILDDSDAAGLYEMTYSFLASPQVDPSLVPVDWIRNHYKWIVWKLACYDRRFSRSFSSKCLTPENVLLQLKYRYDREIDNAERSCLKQILEGDQPPNRKFICCVSSIRRMQLDESESSLEIELTDGWYSLWTVIDCEMSRLLKKGVVVVGTKLMIQGASLINWEGGCSPLQVPPAVKLKISTNSVRRVKWFAKMGFTRCFNPIPTTLKYALPSGGALGVFTAEIVRVYPILHMSKDADGKTVFRNERCAQLIEVRQQQKGTDKAEELYEEVWREVEKGYKPSHDEVKGYSKQELAKSSQPDILWSALELDGESGHLQGLLTHEQLKMISDYKDQITYKIKDEVDRIIKERIKDILPNKKVTKLLKIRVVDNNTQALLSIWNPSVEVTQVLAERKTFNFYNFTSNGKRDNILQLSSSKHSVYNENNAVKTHQSTYSRSVTKLESFKHPGPSVHFGEVDIVGLVVSIQLPDIENGVTKVFLSDPNNNVVAIAFWTSLKAFGCEDLLIEKTIVAAGNLQWRPGSGLWKMPCLFANETSTFSLNPKQSHFIPEINFFREELNNKSIDDIIESSRETIARICSRPRSSWSRDAENVSPANTPTGRNSPRLSPWASSAVAGSNTTPRHPRPSPLTGNNTPRSSSSPASNNATPRASFDQRVRMLSRLGPAPALSPFPVRLCRSEFKSPMSES